MAETLDQAAQNGLDSAESYLESDKKSVYVGNVDYGSTPEELQAHFKACGPISRITIMVDKFTGQPKGFAYIEFEHEESVKSAVLLNDGLFRGRQLKVNAKRTNIPGYFPGYGKGGGKDWKGKGKAKGKKGKAPYYGTWGVPVSTYKKGGGKAKGWAAPY